MTFDLGGRRVIVAGGSNGIGRAIVAAFARSGARVSICARNVEKLIAFRAEIAEEGYDIHVAPCDLGDPADIARYVGDAEATLGGLDVVVNTVSAFGGADSDEDWSKSVGVDLMATVRLGHAVTPVLCEAGGGLIVNFASTAALHAAPRTPSYGAIKAAIVHYTTTQAVMLAKDAIRVNAIAPASIDFPGGLWDERRTSEPELYERALKSIPLGAFGRPEDVAGAILFLASEHGRFITGQTLVIDGGQSLV